MTITFLTAFLLIKALLVLLLPHHQFTILIPKTISRLLSGPTPDLHPYLPNLIFPLRRTVSSDTGNPFKLSAITKALNRILSKLIPILPRLEAQMMVYPPPLSRLTLRPDRLIPRGSHQIQFFLYQHPIRASPTNQSGYVCLPRFPALPYLGTTLALRLLTLGLFFRLYPPGNPSPSLKWTNFPCLYVIPFPHRP